MKGCFGYLKIFCDTNILLNPKFLLTDYSKVVISIVSVEELDGLKNDDRVGYLARQAIKKIEFADNVEIVFQIENHIPIPYLQHKNDNTILRMVQQTWETDNEILFLCDDYNLCIKAKGLGLPYKKFEFEKENEFYSGIRSFTFTDEEFLKFIDNLGIYNFYPNEYVIINNLTLNDQFLFTWNGKTLDEVKVKPISNKYVNKINPLDIYQKAFIHMLQNDNVKIKITDSIYGVGKSFLMIHWSLQMIEKGKASKLFFVKSDSPPKGRKEFPAIPGDVVDKCEPLLGVLCDTTSEDNVTSILLRNHELEILPIQHAKGRSLKNSILYINECQDFTPSEMERLLSRIGEDTYVLLDGSTAQIDNKYCIYRNGLTVASNNFKDKYNSAQVNMINDYRSEISKMVSQMNWDD